jgi:3',5'-nucleoside bisphosphate phosphatase
MTDAPMNEPLTAVRADLHIHTALSACGDDEMSPPAIVDAALAAGLRVIAVCDHNAAGNTGAVGEAAGSRLTVIAGMEITTAEEVHVVGLFPTVAAAANAADEVRETLPVADDDYTRFFGEQYLMSADGTIYGTEPRALALATSLSLDEAVALVKRYGGLVVAAHIDRPTFGVIAQLGFFPFEAGFDAVEVSRHVPVDSPAADGYAEYGLPVVRSSDSHYLEDVGCVATVFGLAAPTFPELVLAIKHREGRTLAHA